LTQIVLCQPLADLRSLYTHDGIVASVVVDRAAEHLGAKHSLTEAIQLSGQCMLYDHPKEVLCAMTTHERFAGKHFLEVAAHGSHPLGRKFSRICFFQHSCLFHGCAEVYHGETTPEPATNVT
jgi:low temperature requirement protein LtrA